MDEYLAELARDVIVIGPALSLVCLGIRRWLIKKGDPVATMPAQSRLLVTNSAAMVVLDSFAFAVVFSTLSYLFRDVALGWAAALAIAIFATPLQIKLLLEKRGGGKS